MASQGWCRASRTTSQSPRPWPVAEWPTSSSGKAGAPSSQAGSCPPQRTNITAASRTSCARRALLRVSGGTGREATGWVFSLKVGERVKAQDGGRGTRWLPLSQLGEAHVGIERPLSTPVLTESNLAAQPPPPPPGVAEQFAITEATLSAWSSLDDEELQPEDSTQGAFQLQGTAGTSRQGGWSSPQRDTKDSQQESPFPYPFFPSYLGLAVPAPAFPGAALIRKERLGGVQLDLALGGFWVLLSQTWVQASLASSHRILPISGRVGDRGPEGEPLVPILTSCSYRLCSFMGRKLSSERHGNPPDVE